MKKNGLKIKFVLSICGIILFLLILGNLLIIAFQNQMMQSVINYFQKHMDQMISDRKKEKIEHLQHNVKWNADIFCRSLSSHVFNYNMKDIEKSLKSFMEYPEIRAVKVFEVDDTVLAMALKKTDNIVVALIPSNQTPTDFDFSNLALYKTNIMYDNQKFGQIIFYYSYNEINNQIAALKKNANEKITQTIDNANYSFNRARYYQIIGSMFVVLLLIFCIIICLNMLIIKPLQKVTRIAQELSQFDISINVDTNREDEIGFLFDSINKMILSFRNIMLEIQSKCSLLSQTSENLVNISSNLYENSKEIHDDSEMIASDAVEMRSNISKIAKASDIMNTNIIQVHSKIDNLNENIVTVAAATEEMSQSMHTIRTSAQKGKDITISAVQITQNTEKLIESLAQGTREIGSVTSFIKRIAHKTDTLSINANIIASGTNIQSGNSFEPIAREIRRFSMQSKESADNITIQIDSMKQISFDVIQFINNFNRMIQNINESAEEIFMSIDQQNIASQEIASNAAQANVSTRDIKLAISHLDTSSEDVNHLTSIINDSSNAITQNIQRIGLKISDNYSISQKIHSAAQEVKDFSVGFQEIVSKFKLKKE